MDLDLEKVNRELQSQSPEEIIRWSLSLGKRVFATTSFGPNAAVMLHLISSVEPEVPIVWVDSGYNVRDTYLVAEQLMERLPLNMHIYAPEMTAERRNALLGGVPTIDEPELHQEFTQQVKLGPFNKALNDLQPEVWLTGIRKEETSHRQTLDIVSVDNRGIIKVAPVFYWSEEEVDDFRRAQGLPSCKHYYDPTKVDDNRECGLHTSA